MLDLPNFEFVLHDITNPIEMQVDAIYNLAIILCMLISAGIPCETMPLVHDTTIGTYITGPNFLA